MSEVLEFHPLVKAKMESHDNVFPTPSPIQYSQASLLRHCLVNIFKTCTQTWSLYCKTSFCRIPVNI